VKKEENAKGGIANERIAKSITSDRKRRGEREKKKRERKNHEELKEGP